MKEPISRVKFWRIFPNRLFGHTVAYSSRKERVCSNHHHHFAITILITEVKQQQCDQIWRNFAFRKCFKSFAQFWRCFYNSVWLNFKPTLAIAYAFWYIFIVVNGPLLNNLTSNLVTLSNSIRRSSSRAPPVIIFLIDDFLFVDFSRNFKMQLLFLVHFCSF